jgi:hypothetical protein
MLEFLKPDQNDSGCNRRRFLQQSAALGGLCLSGASLSRAAPTVSAPRRPKVACIFTEFTRNSHAHVILENFLEKYPFNGQVTDPGVDIVSFWGDQFRERGDLTREVSRHYKIPLYKTIEEALCLGGKTLAVDAVLAIGENGTYPRVKEWVVQYPRKRFFDESVAVMRRAGRFIPYFNDKQFSYRWDWAREMYDTARELKIPLMGGSSVPLAQRIPPLELPDGVEIAEAMFIHGGSFENYGIHGFEALQSMVEFRKGGETGISQIEVLYDNELWEGAKKGKWPFELAAAAMQNELGRPYTPNMELRDPGKWGVEPLHGFLVTYKDGMKGYILKIGAYPMRWNFACRLKGEKEIRTTRFYPGPWKNRNFFRAFCHAIQHFFIHGQAPYPVERALLANGAVLAAVDAYFQRGGPLATPHLEFAYKPQNFREFREMGESWKKLLTDETPEPAGICRLPQCQ